MLRVKLIPILLPVVAGAAFLWYRSRKKSKGLPVEDAEEEEDSAHCSEVSSSCASPSPPSTSLPKDHQRSHPNIDIVDVSADESGDANDGNDSGAISSDEATISEVGTVQLLAKPKPASTIADVIPTDDAVIADSIITSIPGPASPSREDADQQQKLLRRLSNSSLTSSTTSGSGTNIAAKSASGDKYVVAPKNGSTNNNGVVSLNNGNAFSSIRSGVYRRRTRGSISDSITSTGSECDNWRENMGKTWEPLPEQRSASSSSALLQQQSQHQQQLLSQQQRGRTTSTSSNSAGVAAAATADEKSANLNSTTKNGIIVTYPPVSNKNKWNHYHHQNNNHHLHQQQHHHYQGMGPSNGMSASSRSNGPSPPPPPPPVHPDQHVVYEFSFPSECIGRLIGKGGRNLQQMTKETNAQISVRKEPLNAESQIVVVHGRHADVQNLLQSIRTKFPKHRHPNIDMTPINVPLSRELTTPSCLPLSLPDGAAFDAVVASVISAGQIFLQLPTHPTFPNLPRLDACMMACYSAAAAPPLPTPIESGAICAAPLSGGWFRAQFVQMLDSGAEQGDAGADGNLTNSTASIAWIRWVDYGGYSQVAVKDMRQIRSDFLNLPFQAVECYMANLSPPENTASTDTEEGSSTATSTTEFSFEAAVYLEELVQNSIVQAQVVSYAADGTPNVHLYRSGAKGEGDTERTLINKQLVDSGFASWVEASAIDETYAAGEDVFC